MKSTHDYKLRIIDANLNRIGEGLRVLEEYARLALNDDRMTRLLKNMRHHLIRNVNPALQLKLLKARDAAGDVGAGMKVVGEKNQRNTVETIVANARRVQESFRVMEEMAKAPELDLETENYEKERFDLYTIEKELISKLLRKEKLERLTGLYVIIDVESLQGRSPLDAAAAAIRGGVKVIQLRDKKDSRLVFYDTAIALKRLCAEQDVLFIVNDSLEVALAADADGLNVGQQDLPVAEARRFLPIDKLLGASAGTTGEARAAWAAGADYLGVGAIYTTATKVDAGVVGLGTINRIKQKVDLPIVAIGGINKGNISDVIEAGADAAAVISAVMGAGDIEKATRELIKIIEREKRG